VSSLGQLVAFAGSDWLLRTLLERRPIGVFQPVVRAGDPTGVYAQECLLRAEAPDGSVVSAGAVLEAARQAGLLAQTDPAARHGAVREAARHGAEGHPFVNLAPARLQDPATRPRSTLGALDGAGIPRGKVVFEITETDQADDVYALTALTDYCRDNGFRVALDDVGSGCSSPNSVHRPRPGFIKLDAEPIGGVDRDPHKAAIARRVTELARELGASTVAEGIETPQELGWVQSHGATFAQGWLIAKPADPPVGDGRALAGPRQEARAAPR
jgi:EAL domain-containing protein (putative c-di-GMP-specific phosphodiesterase class I)